MKFINVSLFSLNCRYLYSSLTVLDKGVSNSLKGNLSNCSYLFNKILIIVSLCISNLLYFELFLIVIVDLTCLISLFSNNQIFLSI